MENTRKNEAEEYPAKEDVFKIRAYDKAELALLYCPGRTEETACRNLLRWIRKCEALVQELQNIGYNVHRHRFLRKEVEVIVRHLGEP